MFSSLTVEIPLLPAPSTCGRFGSEHLRLRRNSLHTRRFRPRPMTQTFPPCESTARRPGPSGTSERPPSPERRDTPPLLAVSALIPGGFPSPGEVHARGSQCQEERLHRNLSRVRQDGHELRVPPERIRRFVVCLGGLIREPVTGPTPEDGGSRREVDLRGSPSTRASPPPPDSSETTRRGLEEERAVHRSPVVSV